MNKTEKRLVKTLAVIKTLPASLSALAENDDNGQWVWATREIVDSVGDIVRVDGVDFSQYHNPPETKLKILAQHLRELPDGTAPVVGVVEQVVKTTTSYKGKLVKGIALYFRWLRDATTDELLPLASHYKQMVDAGGIDSVSVGLLVTDYEPIEETGGIDITQSSIYECSMVTIAANPAATVVKELIDIEAMERDSHRVKEVVPCEIDGTCEIVEKGCNCGGKKGGKSGDNGGKKELEAPAPTGAPDEMYVVMRGLVADELSKQLSPMTEAIKAMTDAVRRMEDRCDVIESAIVVATESKAQESHDHKSGPAIEDIKKIGDQIDRMTKFLT